MNVWREFPSTIASVVIIVRRRGSFWLRSAVSKQREEELARVQGEENLMRDPEIRRVNE